MRFPTITALVLVASMAAAIPVSAQDGAARPIARAMELHAKRLARVAQIAQPAPPPASKAGSGKRVVTGAAIGFGVGAVLGSTIGQEACLDSPVWHCAVGSGALFGAIGGLIAWLTR